MIFDSNLGSDLKHSKKDGVFRVDVKLYFKFRIKCRLGDIIGGYTTGNIKCGLEVPFGSNGTKVMNAFED